MGFRAKGYHEKSSESSTGDRKRFRHDTGSESEDDHETPTGPVEYRQAGFVRPFIPGLTEAPIGYPVLMMPTASPVVHVDDFSFKPQLPVEPPQRNAQGEFSFLEMAYDLLNRFYISGIDTWSTVMSLARMVLLAQGWGPPPSTEDGEKVLREVLAQYPNSIVLVMDPAAKLLRNRIVALSPIAQELLGPVARHQKGLEKRIISLSDAWPCLSAAFAAHKNPGSEQSAVLHVMAQDNVLRLANCVFRAFPNEHLLVVRASLL